MSQQSNQNLQDSKRVASKGAKAAKTGVKGGVKAGKAAAKGAEKVIALIPPEALLVIAGVILALVLILSIVEGLNSVQMDNNEYRTAVKEEAKNMPADDAEAYEANYNLGLAIKQTLELSDVIHEAKQKEKEKIAAKYPGKKVVCESDQAPVFINEDYPEYFPTAGGSGGTPISPDAFVSSTTEMGQATTSENGTTKNGKPGDQTSREVALTQYKRGSGAYNWKAAFRAKDPAAQLRIADAVIKACKNDNIGYDIETPDRKTCYKEAEKVGFQMDKITAPCELSCSELANVCIAAAGLKSLGAEKVAYYESLKNFLSGSSEFTKIDLEKLQPGDIIISGSHTAIVTKSPNRVSVTGTVTTLGGGGAAGGSFQQGVVNWVNSTVALKKYGYKMFDTSKDPELCPICHPEQRGPVGWNCIGFTFAAWHHGGGLPSKCSCGVIDNSAYEKMYRNGEAWASQYATKTIGVECKVIMNGGKDIPASMMEVGDIMIWYSGGGSYYHNTVYVGDGKYAESTRGSRYVRTNRTYRKDVKLLIRYVGAGGSSGPAFTKKDSFTVLEEITPSTGTRYSIGCVGSSNCAQSFAYTGDGFAVSFVTTNHAPAHVKIYDKKGNGKDSVRADAISHANAASMTPDGKYMVAGTMNPSSTTGYIFSVKEGLKKDDTKALPAAASSMAYDRETGKYILATSGSFKVYDNSLSHQEASHSRNAHRVSFCQDIGAANGYIFACQTIVKGRENYGKNYVDVYNEVSGDYCGSYYIKYGELESVDVVDGELVLLVHILGRVNYIHFTGINVGNMQGGGISSYTTKHDLDVLASYSVTLSNTGLFKGEEKESGENKTWIDKLASGDVGTNNYSDLKGNKLKLYWFGEKRGRVNYKSDLKKKLGEGWFRRKKVYFYEVIQGQKALDAMKEDGVDPNASPAGSNAGAQGAVEWAKKTASDNSFTYGKPGSARGAGNRPGCYYCGTNQKKKPKKYEKTYMCLSFVTAAYAHGANDPEVLKLCKSADCLESSDSNFRRMSCWKKIGLMKDLKVSDLEPGDVLVYYDRTCSNCHMAMYIGDGDIVDATSEDYWGPRSIAVRKGEAKKYLKMKLGAVPSKSYVMRYVGPGGGASSASITGSDDIVYLRERPISDILSDMDMEPDETYSGSGRESMFDATNLEAAIGMSDNTENMLYTGYMRVNLNGASSLADLGSGDFGLPLEKGSYTITSHVGKRTAPTAGASTNHSGVDMAAPIGTPVYASLSGTVTVARKVDRGGYGLYVQIKSGDYDIIYAHLSKVMVNDGDVITKGQNIGQVGSTGTSTGPHLHFEVHKNGKVVDPESFMKL